MNANEKNEVSDALNETTYAYLEDNQQLQCHRTLAWDSAGDICRTEELSRMVIQTAEAPFSLKFNKFSNRTIIQPTKLGHLILNSLKIDITAVAKHYPTHALNPYVDLYFKQAADRNLFARSSSTNGQTDDEVFERIKTLNGFVEAVRKIGGSTEFKKIIGHFERASNKNFRELCKFIDAHFALYSRLLVLRIDFGYQKPKGWPSQVDNTVSYEEAKTHRINLLKYLKKGLPPKSFVNFALKMEYGLDKHWHYHMLVLLDGSIVREDVTIAKLIGEHWKKSITQGKGLYWNCNANKDSYKCCGIGMLSHYGTAAREGLKKAALYMTKTDYYVRLLVPGNDRIFWKGNMPKPKTTTAGRPRSKTCEQPGASPG